MKKSSKERWAVYFENKGAWASYHHVSLYETRNCIYKGSMVLVGNKEDVVRYARIIIENNFPSGYQTKIVKVTRTKRPAYKLPN